jgi:hypothetical protein
MFAISPWLGPAIPGTSVNMGALAALYDIRRRGIAAPIDLKGTDRALDAAASRQATRRRSIACTRARDAACTVLGTT